MQPFFSQLSAGDPTRMPGGAENLEFLEIQHDQRKKLEKGKTYRSLQSYVYGPSPLSSLCPRRNASFRFLRFAQASKHIFWHGQGRFERLCMCTACRWFELWPQEKMIEACFDQFQFDLEEAQAQRWETRTITPQRLLFNIGPREGEIEREDRPSAAFWWVT